MTNAEFISKYWPISVWEHITTGIPASITLAQGLVESDSGNSKLAQYNNFFGIKGYTNPNNYPLVYANDDLPNEPFIAYPSAYAGFKDHSAFLLRNPRYSDALSTKNYNDFALALSKDGYATAPSYPYLLSSTIADNGLYKYDFIGNNKYLLGITLLVLIASSVYLLIIKHNKK